MTESEILDKIQTILQRDISMHSMFMDVIKDSLDALDIITEIEDTFDIVIPMNITTDIKTIGNLVSYIQSSIVKK
jgi:acyl carrier protein